MCDDYFEHIKSGKVYLFTGGELKIFPNYRRKYTNKDYDYILSFGNEQSALVEIYEILDNQDDCGDAWKGTSAWMRAAEEAEVKEVDPEE